MLSDAFREKYGGDFENICFLKDYHPYRKGTNPLFNDYSRLLLDLKDNKDSAVEKFFGFLDKHVAQGVPMAVVPGHDPAKPDSGLRRIVTMLAANDRVDAGGCLVRTVLIEKLAHGGDRSIETHLNSIEVCDAHLIEAEDVLLLDDVTTTGNSLQACKQLLLAAGVGNVLMLAFGKTV